MLARILSDKLFQLFSIDNWIFIKLILIHLTRRKGEFIVFIKGIKIYGLDTWSVVGMYNEIFRQNIYDFEADNPTIVDCGANIGMASAYWLSKFPKAKIVCVEPDPDLFRLLKINLSQFKESEITFMNKALWSSGDLKLKFGRYGNDAGSLFSESQDIIEVESLCLSSILDNYEKIDFLKLDIEGAETEVLKEAEKKLFRVSKVFVEYHSYKGGGQTLSEILAIFERNDFRYTMVPARKVTKPFRDEFIYGKYHCDFQMNIFAEKNRDVISYSNS